MIFIFPHFLRAAWPFECFDHLPPSSNCCIHPAAMSNQRSRLPVGVTDHSYQRLPSWQANAKIPHGDNLVSPNSTNESKPLQGDSTQQL